MKRCLSLVLAVLLLLTCLPGGVQEAEAASKEAESRAIAIVFDNSGSMYNTNEPDWCRATYAMEVFASMLNSGDQLLIYPMNPIKVDGKEYTRENPYILTDATQAGTIRKISTLHKQDGTNTGTPIESIDCAAEGLKAVSAKSKYMIVLTDGSKFHMGVREMSTGETRNELDKRFEKYAGQDMTVMFLGVNANATMPNKAESQYFVKKKAGNSAEVRSMLTQMCNQVFGRDTLPDSHKSGKTINLDVSISKLIVFAQGENISNLKVTDSSGKPVGTMQGAPATTKYSELGSERYTTAPVDKSLQGMMVTYTDCASGQYTISYSGNATDVEIYYEPDVELDFVFTDMAGNEVDPKTLYEGTYKLSFGMKDAKLGKLVDSKLLGTPHYEGTYTITNSSNGAPQPISADGSSGEKDVTLQMGDKFKATLTVTYLSGYSITKDSTDFNWPEDGIEVIARPAGDLKLEISGGDGKYSLQKLEDGAPYIAKVYYQGKQISGDELENSVDLKWQPETSNAEITKEFAGDHYKLFLGYKNPQKPQETVCGDCSVFIYAEYTAPGSEQAVAQAPLAYTIDADTSALKMEVLAEEDYIVISELEASKAIEVKLTLNGQPLTAEQMKKVELNVVSDIKYKKTANEANSSYSVKLLPTDGIEEGDYSVDFNATYKDDIGRVSKVEDSVSITLSTMALWIKWLIGIVILLLLIIIIWRIMRLRVLPKRVHQQSGECYMSVNGMNVTEGAELKATLSGKKLAVKVEYAGNISGINISSVAPGKESYLSKKQTKRSILVTPANVTAVGEITSADIGGVSYILDQNGRLVPDDEQQKPFNINHLGHITLDGKLEDGGKTKRFHADIPISFK